ncbi:hypothetical protein C8T65DRAFT_246655 [Cerioporus squamosus]|nr:hypothetical protein C8T65DRAFT_246655 [Cerioporus squamosus]
MRVDSSSDSIDCILIWLECKRVVSRLHAGDGRPFARSFCSLIRCFLEADTASPPPDFDYVPGQLSLRCISRPLSAPSYLPHAVRLTHARATSYSSSSGATFSCASSSSIGSRAQLRSPLRSLSDRWYQQCTQASSQFHATRLCAFNASGRASVGSFPLLDPRPPPSLASQIHADVLHPAHSSSSALRQSPASGSQVGRIRHGRFSGLARRNCVSSPGLRRSVSSTSSRAFRHGTCSTSRSCCANVSRLLDVVSQLSPTKDVRSSPFEPSLAARTSAASIFALPG